jgi:putative copper export protein
MKEFILFIHVVAASFWIGGMLFMAIVLSPYVRKLPTSVQAFQEVGKRYSFWGTVIGLPVLFITGVFNSYFIGGVKSFSLLLESYPYVNTLKLKLFFFILTVLIAIFHDFYFGRKAHVSKKYKNITRFLGIMNLIIGLFIIYLAVKLRFGG